MSVKTAPLSGRPARHFRVLWTTVVVQHGNEQHGGTTAMNSSLQVITTTQVFSLNDT